MHYSIPERRFVIAFITVIGSALCAFAVNAAEVTSPENSDVEREIVKLTNQQRASHGLQPLTRDPQLTAASRKHAAAMARAHTLAHTLDGSTMTSRIRESGYRYLASGENIAFNEPTAGAAVDAWMNSPGHRANILNENFTELGVGVAYDDDGRPYYTQDFGRPVSAGPTASATFSIVNEMNEPATIQLPGNANSTRLDPGSSGSFTVSGIGELPPIEVRVDDDNRKLKFENGGAYRLMQGADGLKIEREQ